MSIDNPNVRAFLDLICYSEGTINAPDPYRVCFGFKHTIKNFSDHPAITGEWLGERLPNKLCLRAGLKLGCRSTAAGAYQIIKPTWINLKRSLNLPDFSPRSQDLAAWSIVSSMGAADAVVAGKVRKALALCRKQWASFPGAGYGQGEKRLSALLAAYQRAGGTLV